MITSKPKNQFPDSIRLFGSIRVMAASSLFVAMSIVLGKFAHIAIGDSIRISFENLPVLMAGIFFGPLVGGAVGVSADLIGCFLKGYAINPFITLGAASIGIISGLIFKLLSKRRVTLRCFSAIFFAHIIGSMLIKSVGLYIYYSTPMKILMWRFPIYLATAALESVLICLLLSNKAFTQQLNKFTKI